MKNVAEKIIHARHQIDTRIWDGQKDVPWDKVTELRKMWVQVTEQVIGPINDKVKQQIWHHVWIEMLSVTNVKP